MDFLKEPGVVSGYPDYTVVLYLVYVALSLGLAIWVGQTLFRNGRVFLVDAFGGREALADAINHLLLVGFYLINIGYISFALTSEGYVESWRELLEVLSRKIGLVAIILGVLHVGNVYAFRKIHQHEKQLKEHLDRLEQSLSQPK
jgi:protein-S-isoprenylcysteine O-methyltransferase Ste14